jgi:chromosome segregation ATPase
MKKADSKENLKKILKEQREEYQRYLGAAMEHFESGVGAIAEQYGDIKETLGEHGRKLDSHTEMIGSLKVDIEIIKEDVEFIKNSLKIKVDLEEFSALERRVALLEKRLKLSTS